MFRDCDYPKGFMVWIGLHGVMFLFLFSDFYKTRYRKVTAKLNGYKHIPSTNGVTHNNKGACMVSNYRFCMDYLKYDLQTNILTLFMYSKPVCLYIFT